MYLHQIPRWSLAMLGFSMASGLRFEFKLYIAVSKLEFLGFDIEGKKRSMDEVRGEGRGR